MPSVEQVSDRLLLHTISPDWIATRASFDRARQRADIVWFAAVVPFRRQILYLAEITGAKVRKREYSGRKPRYCVTLRRKIGDDVHLYCRTRDEAMDVMRKVNEFLQAE